MFPITLLDHLRLSFGHVVYSCKAHGELAERLNQRIWHLRLAELGLLSGGLAAAVVAAIGRGGAVAAVFAAVLTGAALGLYTFTIALNLEARVYAHRWCAARLWLVREKYRAVLSEVRDGILTVDAARERRDTLLNELHTIDEHAPSIDRPAYRSARETLAAADERALSDEEIDRFLPDSLRKTSPVTTPASEPSRGV